MPARTREAWPKGTLCRFATDFNCYRALPDKSVGSSVVERARRGAMLVAVLVAVPGCEDRAAGFAGGLGRAIALLLLLGLVLPATVVGLVAYVVVRRRRRGDRR